MHLGRVFNMADTKVVHKFYDIKINECQLDLTKISLPEAELIDLSKDGVFKCLKYNFRIGMHIPDNVKQIADVLQCKCCLFGPVIFD